MSIRHSRLENLKELPTLFLEFHGGPAAVREQVEVVEAFAAEFGGGGFSWADTPEARSRLWKARHTGYYANLQYIPGKSVMGSDACVPISELADCIRETEADIAESGLIAALTGHVGDGNFHLGILYDADKVTERDAADALACEKNGLARYQDGRHVLRRAWHRNAQAWSGCGRAPRRASADVGHQTRSGSRQHYEPRQASASPR